MSHTINEINDKLFDFAYSEALNDATSQRAYLGSKVDIASIDSIKRAVKKYVDAVLQGKLTDYNLEFNATVESIKKELKLNNLRNGDKKFTFGNIQKLINMTVKYIYTGSVYCCEKNRHLFEYCHCPMDRKMIELVWEQYKLCKSDDKYNEKLLITYVEDGRQHSGFSDIRWSRIDFDQNGTINDIQIYKNFQEMVRFLAKKKGIMPIEYDFFEH